MGDPEIGYALQSKDNKDHHVAERDIGFPWQGAMKTQGLGTQKILFVSFEKLGQLPNREPSFSGVFYLECISRTTEALLPTGERGLRMYLKANDQN